MLQSAFLRAPFRHISKTLY